VLPSLEQLVLGAQLDLWGDLPESWSRQRSLASLKRLELKGGNYIHALPQGTSACAGLGRDSGLSVMLPGMSLRMRPGTCV
jgi:hypothetical protein